MTEQEKILNDFQKLQSYFEQGREECVRLIKDMEKKGVKKRRLDYETETSILTKRRKHLLKNGK